MDASKTLRRPANWQDFETLCLKLWGEIWQCPEIQKNGRLGQSQNGVDIFGIPINQNAYYGIQCKGKSEYNDAHAQFTQDEILAEIEKAMKFEPPLKKLYFATTALNDSAIQTFIRKKNIEHIRSGQFEVHLYAWESIVDLIDENKQTHEWYVKSQKYKTRKQIAVTFGDGSKELTICPKFKRTTTRYRRKIDVEMEPQFRNALMGHQKILDAFAVTRMTMVKINLSYCELHIVLTNSGSDPIEDYKLNFQFSDAVVDLADTNRKGDLPIFSTRRYSSTTLYPESKVVVAVPIEKILVGDDSFSTEAIFLKSLPEKVSIPVTYKLISKDFKETGELLIHVEPEIMDDTKTVWVTTLFDIKVDEVSIADFIVDEKDEE